YVPQYLQSFRAEFRGKDGEPGGVSAGTRETGDNPGPKDVITDCDNGDRLRRLLGYFGREIAGCKNDVHFQTDQLGGELGKLLWASLSIAQLDGDVLAVNETQRAQSLPKRLHPGRRRGRVARPQKADPGSALGLLRARSERPRHRAAERGDEAAPLHSITSSARASRVGGTVTPS